MPYGAFVDIGGIEGLVHLNNLSWERVESVEEMLSEGQEVEESLGSLGDLFKDKFKNLQK